MKRFLTKLFVFLIIPVTYFGFNGVYNLAVAERVSVDFPAKRVLIAGDSHPQSCINPVLFRSAENIAQTAEPYVLTFWKLATVFKYYRPDTLILGFAPHNIAKFNDYKFSDAKWAEEMCKRSLFMERFTDIDTIIKVDYRSYYKMLFRELCFYPKKKLNFLTGNFYRRDGSDISDFAENLRLHFYYRSPKAEISPTAIAYLDSIINLCKSEGVLPISVNMPVHKTYAAGIPRNIAEKYDSLKSELKKKNVRVIDCQDKYYEDDLFLNSDHLNFTGAGRFTRDLINILNNKTAGENRDQRRSSLSGQY